MAADAQRNGTISTYTPRSMREVAAENENLLVASLLGRDDEFRKIAALVKPQDLINDPAHRVFRAMLLLNAQGKPIDFAGVYQQVMYAGDLDNVGHDYIAKLDALDVGVRGPMPHAERVIEQSQRREIGALVNRLGRYVDSPDGPLLEFIADVAADLERLKSRTSGPAVNPLIAGALDNTAFDAADFKREWLIQDVLVKNEPGVLAGASKSMKTAIAVDAAISLASGAPFLGTFDVLDPGPVYIISAESGAASLQSRMREVCRAKGISPAGLPIQWYTRIEALSTDEGCAKLEAALRHFGSVTTILDPGYLLMGGPETADSPGNYYVMGKLLERVGTACLNAGATCIVATHANGRLPIGEPMELSHISYSGYQQWARQWWLINRRTKYEDDGRHALTLRYGGSAGHTGLANVDIDEGVFDRHGGGKKWEVVAVDARGARMAEKEVKSGEATKKIDEHGGLVISAMLLILGAGNEVASRNALEEATGLTRGQVTKATNKLVADGAVVRSSGRVICANTTREVPGIRRPDGWST